MKNLVILITGSIIALPCAGQDVVSLGVNPDTGLEEIRVNISGLPEGAKPLEMVLIPAGTFLMGSPASERGRDDNESPQHEVTITKSFYLGKYEVTQVQWEAVMGSNPSRFAGKPNNPVERVSWNDCQAFIEKLNAMGLGAFHLPTEAQWEYACRAGTTTRFSFGDALECRDLWAYCEIMDQYMWWIGNNTYGAKTEGTKEVALKLPNDWGLFDMSGNVHEWCEDDWHGSYTFRGVAPVNGSAWVESPRGSRRVARGGDWHYFASSCRSAARSFGSPAHGPYYFGLRLVRLVDEAPISVSTITPTPTRALPPTVPTTEQQVLLINVKGKPLKHTDNAQELHQTLLWANANATYIDLDQNGLATDLIQNHKYDQIWVFDLSYEDDDYPTDWQAIANWFNAEQNRQIICDGRMLASYRWERFEEEGRRLTGNYYYNLKIRGGGLLLATDHDHFHNGINTINELIGLEPFVGIFDTSIIPIDIKNPLMTTPNDMGLELINDSSPSQAPYGLQPNGVILYAVAWHFGNLNTPGISSTVKFQIPLHTATPTDTPLPTETQTQTPTQTNTPTNTPTASHTPTYTPTKLPTATYTPTPAEPKSTPIPTFPPAITFSCTNNFSLRVADVIPIGPQPVGMLCGDFNEDGKIDLVVADSVDRSLLFLFGTGRQPFFNTLEIQLDVEVEFIAEGDINHDGHTDIAVLSYVDEALQIFLGDGNGTLGHRETIPVDSFFTQHVPTMGRLQPLAIGDMNGDGFEDIVVAVPSGDFLTKLVVHRGGDSINIEPMKIPLGLGVRQEIQFVEIADGEIFVGVAGPPHEVIVLSKETDSFSEICRMITGDTIAGNNIVGFRMGDVNTDGLADMIIAPFDNTVRLLVGNKVPYSRRIGDLVEKVLIDDVLITDLDKDGLPDLLYANREIGAVGVQSISVVCGLSLGEFAEAVTFPTNRASNAFTRLYLELGDVNLDGREDVILLDPLANEIIIFSSESQSEVEETTGVHNFALW